MGANATKERIESESLKNTSITDDFSIQIFSYEDYSSCLLPDPSYVTLTLHQSQLFCKFDNQMILLDIPSSVTMWKLQRNSFGMILCVSMNKELYIWRVVAPTLKTFIKWKDAILISKRPTWIYKDNCQICDKKFNLIRRQHHCRTCGKAICNACSRMETILYMYGYRKPQILCNICANRLPVKTQSLIQSIKSGKYSKILDGNTSQVNMRIYEGNLY